MKKEINYVTDFGIARPPLVSIWDLLTSCLKNPYKTEQTTCLLGITKDEYQQLCDISNLIYRIMYGVMTAFIVVIFILASVFGKDSVQMTIAGIPILFVAICTILLVVALHGVDKGLRYHAMRYDYYVE